MRRDSSCTSTVHVSAWSAPYLAMDPSALIENSFENQ